MTSCCDDESDLAAALTQAVGRADLVITSGGLGPTEDDLTVDVTARLAAVEVTIDDPARKQLQAVFAGRIEVTPNQLRQVRVPAGSRVLGNPLGLAPSFEVTLGAVPVICLPGFPREIAGIFEGGLTRHLRELREARGNVERIARQIYRVFGRGESQVATACAGLVDGVPGTSIHYQVKFPEVLVKLVVRDRDAAAAEARLAGLDHDLRERLGKYLYGAGDETLVERVVRRARAAGVTIATAESCTGGMLGELLTRMPGSSAAYVGGAITYANAEKVRQLGVLPETLEAHGAVSEQTVIEMARGARDRTGATLAVSVSGVAGPDGGSPDKPVGTVWLALASPSGIETRKLAWPSTRDQIRLLAAWWALKMLDTAIEGGAS